MRPNWQRPDFPSYRGCRKAHQSRVIYSTIAEWVEAQGYLLGVGLERHRLELHAGCLFFNHDHFDVGHPWEDGPEVEPRYSRLWEDFHFWMWRLLVANKGWKYGPVYSRLERTFQAPILDAEEYWRIVCYDTAQAVAAGLFEKSEQYPGLVFLPQDVLTPRVFKRNRLIEAMDPGGSLFPDEEVSIQLGVPRIFSHLTREKYAESFAQKLSDYEKEVGPKRVYRPSRVRTTCNQMMIGRRLEIEDILEKTRGHEPPPKFTQSYAPYYTSKTTIRVKTIEYRDTFWDQHQEAYEKLAKGKKNVRFPAGTYGWRRRLKVKVLPSEPPPWAGQPLWWPD